MTKHDDLASNELSSFYCICQTNCIVAFTVVEHYLLYAGKANSAVAFPLLKRMIHLSYFYLENNRDFYLLKSEYNDK
jgi:hypothetical protein